MLVITCANPFDVIDNTNFVTWSADSTVAGTPITGTCFQGFFSPTGAAPVLNCTGQTTAPFTSTNPIGTLSAISPCLRTHAKCTLGPTHVY
jgi:hypothetical protein